MSCRVFSCRCCRCLDVPHFPSSSVPHSTYDLPLCLDWSIPIPDGTQSLQPHALLPFLMPWCNDDPRISTIWSFVVGCVHLCSDPAEPEQLPPSRYTSSTPEFSDAVLPAWPTPHFSIVSQQEEIVAWRRPRVLLNASLDMTGCIRGK